MKLTQHLSLWHAAGRLAENHNSGGSAHIQRCPSRDCPKHVPNAILDSMKTLLLAAVLTLVFSIPAMAQNQEKGMWYSASPTTNTVTGDIVIKDGKFTINFRVYPLAPIRALTAAELSAVFAADPNASPDGNLYRLFIPAATQFVHHNTLCGSDDTQWIATYVEGKSLQIAFFSGQQAPKLTFEAITGGSANLCGTYTYSR